MEKKDRFEIRKGQRLTFLNQWRKRFLAERKKQKDEQLFMLHLIENLWTCVGLEMTPPRNIIPRQKMPLVSEFRQATRAQFGKVHSEMQLLLIRMLQHIEGPFMEECLADWEQDRVKKADEIHGIPNKDAEEV